MQDICTKFTARLVIISWASIFFSAVPDVWGLEQNYNKADSLAKVAGEYYRNKDYNHALRLTDKALEYWTNHALSYQLKGVIYKEMGNIKEALKYSLMAVEFHKPFAEAHYQLGCIYADLGATAKSDSFFSLADSYFPNTLDDETSTDVKQNLADLKAC